MREMSVGMNKLSEAAKQIDSGGKQIFSKKQLGHFKKYIGKQEELRKYINIAKTTKGPPRLRALQMLVYIGGAGILTGLGLNITSAEAKTLETSDKTQEASESGLNLAIKEYKPGGEAFKKLLMGNVAKGLTYGTLGTIAAKNPKEVYELAKKPVRFGWRAFERLLPPGASAILHGLFYTMTGEHYDMTKTENLLIPSLWNTLMKKYNFGHKSSDPIRRKLLNFLKRGAIPSSVMPLVSKIAGWAMIPAELYQATKTITKTISDKEKEIAQWAKDNNYDPKKAVKMYRVTFDQPKFTRETFYKPMAMMNVPWGDVDLLKDPEYEEIKKSFDDEFRAKYYENKKRGELRRAKYFMNKDSEHYVPFPTSKQIKNYKLGRSIGFSGEEDVMKDSVIDKDDLATGGIASLLKW
jgi:hypothetical protein